MTENEETLLSIDKALLLGKKTMAIANPRIASSIKERIFMLCVYKRVIQGYIQKEKEEESGNA